MNLITLIEWVGVIVGFVLAIGLFGLIGGAFVDGDDYPMDNY